MSREAMQMALWTLEGWANHDNWVWPESALEQAKRNTIEAITALRHALETEQESVRLQCTTCGTVYADGVPPQVAQQEQEPVAWFSTSPDGKLANKFACKPTEGNWVEPLYTAPPKRKWVGLTLEEREHLRDQYESSASGFISAIEAKLKEKNT